MMELAQTLRSERLKQGLSLQDVFERTRISVGVLQSLEEGNFERIGTPLLVRSFVRTYGSVLGIDPEPLLESHMSEIQACDKQQEGILEYKRLTRAFAHKRSRWMLILLVLAAIILAGIAAGTWITQRMEKISQSQSLTKEIIPQEELPSDLPRTAARESAPAGGEVKEAVEVAASAPKIETSSLPGTKEQPEQPAPSAVGVDSMSISGSLSEATVPEAPNPPVGQSSSESAAAGVSTATELQPQEEPPAPQAQGQTLSAEATQDVWIQVKADNQSIYNGLMKPGDKREWKAKEAVQIVVGNAGGIHFKWNGQSLKTLGKSGEVVRLRLPDSKYLE
jgi:cytoskeleton protein RodZ